MPGADPVSAAVNSGVTLSPVIEAVNAVILGKERQVRLALCCLLARGHLLIEDIPGVGKTTLAQTLARVLGLQFRRIQFTSDLLPADLIGVSVFDTDTQQFRFHPGPVFSQMVLADEINRATPKAQSALLEAMEERQISADGQTFPLAEPFFVIATQNPQYQIGTFALPESQLDRFLMRIEIGYPGRDAERRLLAGSDRRAVLRDLAATLDGGRLLALQAEAGRVHMSETLLDYVQDILLASREAPAVALGLSPRAGLGLLAAARAWALLEGRRYVLPEDVQAVAVSVIGHRLQAADGNAGSGQRLAESLLASVTVP